MNGQQYQELFDALLGLREATEMGFNNVYREFQKRDEQWDRRFTALENRVEDGFHNVDERFNAVDERFNAVDERFNAVDERFNAVDDRFNAIDQTLQKISASVAGIASHLGLPREYLSG